MNRTLSNFPWPPPPGTSIAPVWTGAGFQQGEKSEAVLCYEENESHWSDDLTEMHEQEAGRNHPIDLASRRLARHTFGRFCGGKPDALAIEIGCSSGYFLEDIKNEMPQLAVVGSDYIEKPLRALAARIPSVPLLQFDLRQCPLPSENFDAALLLNVLEHIDDDRTALREVARILKPGGVAHIEVPSNPDCYDIYDERLMHHRRYRMGDLHALALSVGFEVLHSTHLGFFAYPAFYAVKQRNKKLLQFPKAKKDQIVTRQIRETRTNPLFSLVMKIEVLLGRLVSYPCGIRCVVVLRKKINGA